MCFAHEWAFWLHQFKKSHKAKNNKMPAAIFECSIFHGSMDRCRLHLTDPCPCSAVTTKISCCHLFDSLPLAFPHMIFLWPLSPSWEHHKRNDALQARHKTSNTNVLKTNLSDVFFFHRKLQLVTNKLVTNKLVTFTPSASLDNYPESMNM